jgi:hypothetical protein
MPVTEEQAPPHKRCKTVHIDTGTIMPNGIESVASGIRTKKHRRRIPDRAKHFQCE